MKKAMLLPLLSTCLLLATSFTANSNMDPQKDALLTFNNDDAVINNQQDNGPGTMQAAVFKSQEYCRAEVKDFEFEAPFRIVSATVYFSGANFTSPAKGIISGSSLKPIKDLMARCVPGTFVIFDEVKVIGPDNQLRSIAGISIRLI